MSSTGNSKSWASDTPDKVNPRKNIVKMTSYPLQKGPIIPRNRTGPHVTQTQYEGLDNSHIKRSHGEKDIEVYECMEEFSNKNK